MGCFRKTTITLLFSSLGSLSMALSNTTSGIIKPDSSISLLTEFKASSAVSHFAVGTPSILKQSTSSVLLEFLCFSYSLLLQCTSIDICC